TPARQRQEKHASSLVSTGSALTVDFQPIKKPKAFQPTVPLFRKASASPAEISLAASSLARLPRDPKRWSGWLDNTRRTYRNMVVQIPGGANVYVFGATRRRLVFTLVPDRPAGDPDGAGKSWGVVRGREVKILKNQAAIRLGRSKRTSKEKSS